jgi:serine phosphatase RsbU (regulator of sigma subunit)
VAELVMTKTLHGDSIVRARRRAQMGLAAEIQWGLLPPLTFASETVAVAGALEPAYDVAGDSLDYAVDARVARLAVFDGMGHGLHSAQLAAMSVAAYRNARRSAQSLTQTATSIDDVLRSVFGGEAFTTAVLAQLDTDTGHLSWVNAGHPAPLILRNGRCVATLDADPGLPLGMDLPGHDSGYRVASVRLEPGDHLVLYTDGMVEARTPTGERYGLPRLLDLLTRHMATGLPIAECLRRLVRALMDHQQGQLSDDATIMLLHWRPPIDTQSEIPA